MSRYPQVEKWNVDLEDWEKILRIECNGLTTGELIVALRTVDIYAAELV
ncbi:hypothetical protein M080_0856 [Bacteroides fragilis str. 3397 T10]|nr:hypothetical protein M080_0856 [Bacteroides fragilis str. 3397 T10]